MIRRLSALLLAAACSSPVAPVCHTFPLTEIFFGADPATNRLTIWENRGYDCSKLLASKMVVIPLGLTAILTVERTFECQRCEAPSSV